MKLKKVLIGTTVIYITYNVGVLIGHIDCLNNLAKKYGDVIFDKYGKLVDQITKNFSITKFVNKEAARAYTMKGE